MEKSMLTLFAALLISACTKNDIVIVYGAVSFVHSCVDTALWLLKRSYGQKEKSLSQSDQDK